MRSYGPPLARRREARAAAHALDRAHRGVTEVLRGDHGGDRVGPGGSGGEPHRAGGLEPDLSLYGCEGEPGARGLVGVMILSAWETDSFKAAAPDAAPAAQPKFPGAN